VDNNYATRATSARSAASRPGLAPGCRLEGSAWCGSGKGKKIAGVCAGFARYMGVDVTLVRVVWLVIALTA